jgi:two-component system response regulator MprA
MKATVLVVEDDGELRSQLCRGLAEEGFRVDGVGSGAEVFERWEALAPDALVLDIGLPDSDGRDVWRCSAAPARPAPWRPAACGSTPSHTSSPTAMRPHR